MFYAMEVKREGGNEDGAFSGWAQSPRKQRVTEVRKVVMAYTRPSLGCLA